MLKGALLTSLLFINPAWAKLVRFDVTGSLKESVPFKEACALMGSKDLPLIARKDAVRLDCMGTTVSAQDVCLKYKKSYGDRSFIRGYVEDKNVVCESARRVDLTYSCEELSYCDQAKKGCESLQGHLAHDLALSKSVLLPKDGTKENELHCHYMGRAQSIEEVIKEDDRQLLHEKI